MRQKLLQRIADLAGRSLPELRYCRPESVRQGCCQLPEHIAQAASIREALREAARQERANTFINPVTK